MLHFSIARIILNSSMHIRIPYDTYQLEATAVKSDSEDIWVLFLSGGNLTTGRERYHTWQETLKDHSICSLSFDYSGVNGSGTILEESSLAGRIQESFCAIRWIETNTNAKEIIVFGASMGGYIGLGLVNKIPRSVLKLLLYAPAAYSVKAHSLKFNSSFTVEIRKEQSWTNSLSYEWLQVCDKPILLLEAENDRIIPGDVLEQYKTIGQKKKHFTHQLLHSRPHNCWGDDHESTAFRDIIFKHILDFIETRHN